MAYAYKTIDLEIVIAFASNSIFPVTMWYCTFTKRALIRQIVIYYYNAGLFRGNVLHNRGKIINSIIFCAILISFISALCCSLTASTDPPVKQYYSFHLVLDENFVAIAIRHLMIQLVFLYQFTFTCLVAVMCGTLYYSLSELFYLFRKDLQADTPDSENMRARMLQYTKLFEIANELEKTLSTTCCLFLCSQMISMYVSLATYVLLDEERLTMCIIWESIPEMSLIPASIIGVTLCASKISSQAENCNIYLQTLHDRLICHQKTDWKTFLLVKAMMNKRLPYMSACRIIKFTPAFIISVFGSLFTYGLLILNFKHTERK
ncbi:uncharacterized protein NPIL_483791 [Nephila pilipes]|uniref:Uncharacterized protein n=1 Tax=Nephila pilipes TaxID=299642 RepID=A0A8X6QWY3_NEPPI|nr:uncharacterized protein NPIL_483791 [Nephila pilipes]